MAYSVSISQVVHTAFRHSLRAKIPTTAFVASLLVFPQFRTLQGPSRRLHTSPVRMVMEWSYLTKHQDKEKPPLPYHTGATIPARTWDPPLEDPRDGHACGKDGLDEDPQNEHPLETCVRYTGVTGDISIAERVDLKIVDEIRVEDLKHSQLAKVKVLDKRLKEERCRVPLPSGKDLTAKFYDPLYQDIENDQSDVFINTYTTFSRETFMYHQLKPLWGTVVP